MIILSCLRSRLKYSIDSFLDFEYIPEKTDKSGDAKFESMHLLMCSLSCGPETVQARFLSSPSRFGGSPGSQKCQTPKVQKLFEFGEKLHTHPIKGVSFSRANAYSITL